MNMPNVCTSVPKACTAQRANPEAKMSAQAEAAEIIGDLRPPDLPFKTWTHALARRLIPASRIGNIFRGRAASITSNEMDALRNARRVEQKRAAARRLHETALDLERASTVEGLGRAQADRLRRIAGELRDLAGEGVKGAWGRCARIG